MTQIQPNNQIQTYQVGTPLYTYQNNVPQQQTVSVSPQPGVTAPYYQYPQTSIYNDPNKQAASGVNIYIYNPSGIGGPCSNSNANVTYGQPTQPIPQIPQPVINTVTAPPAEPSNAVAIANTPISQSEPTPQPHQKTKRVVELTDDYIKSLESYLRSPDESIRKTAVKEIIQRYEEDNSRYDDPALTALLNIALQDPVPNNRVMAMSVIAGGNAHGDENTIAILNNLSNSDKMYGQESKMASSALIKAAQETSIVPDYSPDKKK